MDPGRTMRRWGTVAAGAYAAAGVAVWLAFDLPRALLLFLPCAALALLIAHAVAPLLREPPPGDGPGGARGPSPEPPWWPEFERAIRAYGESLRTRA